MIANGDVIVTLSYPRRDVVGNTKTETYSLVGQRANVATQVANHVASWLDRGLSGPMTMHVVSPYNVIDADERSKG